MSGRTWAEFGVDEQDWAGTGVSVVIPWYGNDAGTAHLIERLDTESRPLQIIVVDDHHPQPYESADPRVMVIRREVNGGFGTAANTGIRAAEHPLVMVLNSDLIVRDDFVDSFVMQLLEHGPVIATPWWSHPSDAAPPYFPGARFTTFRGEVLNWLTPLARFHGKPWFESARGGLAPPPAGALAEVDWVIGAAIAMPTALARELGGFDEDFFMFSEEADLMFRARRAGVRSAVVPDVWMAHIGGASSPSDRQPLWMAQSRLIYAEKRRGDGFPGGSTGLRLALTAATIVNLIWNLIRRALGRPTEPVRSLRRELAQIWLRIRPASARRRRRAG